MGAEFAARAAERSDQRLNEFLRAVRPDQLELDSWIWDEGELLVSERAAVALVRRALHPTRTWIALVAVNDTTDAELRFLVADGVGRAGTALKTMAADTEREALLERLGARRLIDSHTVILDAHDEGVSAWVASAGSRATVRQRDVTDPAVERAVWLLYRRIHRWDPVGDVPTAPPDLYEDASIAASIDGRDGAPLAVALGHGQDPVESAFIGTVQDSPDEASHTATLLAWLVDRGGRVEIEADEGEGAHNSLVETLRQIPGASWDASVSFWEIPFSARVAFLTS